MRIFTVVILVLVLLFLFLEISGIQLNAPGERQTIEEKTTIVEMYDEQGNIVNSTVLETTAANKTSANLTEE